MRWWSELKYLARKLNRRRADRELEEEIRAHLEMEALEKVDDGLSPEEARYAARRAFGSVALATEDSRAWWGFGMLEELWQDLRYGARMMLKNPVSLPKTRSGLMWAVNNVRLTVNVPLHF